MKKEYLNIAISGIAILLLLATVACGNNTHQEKKDNKRQATEEHNTNRSDMVIPIEVSDTNTVAFKEKSTPKIIDTLKIGKDLFTVIQDKPGTDSPMNLIILDSLGTMIYKHDGYGSNGFELEDFDQDGVLDIRIYQITNVGGISEIVMYDKSLKKFRPIVNFGNLNNPVRIKNTNYYYTYHRSGCADFNWGSELVKIENFEAKEVGVAIEGIGCEHDAPDTGIFVYQYKKDNKKLVYAEKRKPGFYDDKWDFIEDYWNKHYKEFK